MVFEGKSESLDQSINNTKIKSSSSMRVLGVTFDNKMEWWSHIYDVISNVNKV